jgi:HK97 family phage portal protein
VSRLARAAAGLPLIALDERRDGANYTTTQVWSEAIELLRQPGAQTTGRRLREQLAVDLLTSGNCYALVTRSGSRVVGLRRLHPARVSIEPGASGEARAYVYDARGAQVTYSADDVLHARYWSADDTPEGLYGVGLTQVLHPDLMADLALAKRSERNGAAGRPAAVLMPKGEPWNPKQREAIERAAKTGMKEADGGLFVLSGEGTLEPLSWTPTEQAIPEQRTFLREQVMAVTGVPPTVMGLPGANFATAQQEAVLYWQSVARLAETLAEAYSRLPRMMGEAPTVRVAHDLSGVPELQTERLPRIEAVERWVALGATPDEAARYEGFADAPELAALPEEVPADTAPMGDPDAEADIVAQAQAVLDLADDADADPSEVVQEAIDLARMVAERGAAE